MANITTIELTDGVATINDELFKGYMKEAFEHLTSKQEAEELFKEVVETVAETTGIKGAKVSKYLKERYKAETKKTTELGELFRTLDEAVA